MSVATALGTSRFAGFPLSSWAFAVRIWIAVVVALYAAFWLQLESASSAAVCVGILAFPTRGQALEKAGYRSFATVIGVVASIAIVGTFSQARDLLLLAFAAWVGLCIYAAGLSDGNRAYAAVLAGYTVAVVAIQQQLDTPLHVFDAGMQRGAAIAVGIAAVAIVNDLLVAPDRHLGLASQLAILHRQVRDHAKSVLRGETSDGTTTATLLRDIASLRPDMGSLATESSGGSNRSAAARSTAVALVAEMHAARVLAALPGAAEPALRDRLMSALEQGGAEETSTAPYAARGSAASVDWAWKELLRRDGEVREGLAALKSGVRPSHEWRTPFYCSHRLAGEAGLRAGLWMAVVSACLVLSGWPLTDVSLTQVAVLIGLGATTPNPRGFTVLGFIVTPIAAILAGVLEFVVLGVTQFPLLAMGLAPFVMASVLMMTLPNQVLSALGRLSLIFMLVIFGPSNPQIYNPEVFLDVSLFVGLAAALLLMAQVLIPPLSDERRRQWLLGSARRELDRLPSRKAPRYVPEEAMFRDAVRLRQIAGEGAATPQVGAILEEAVALFDQAGVIRLCEATLARLTGGPLAGPADQARKALATRDAQAIRRAALALHDTAAKDALLAASHVMGFA
jgi:uncharacterized membrane protein YccC